MSRTFASVLLGSYALQGLASSPIPMNCVNFEGGLRLTVNVNPQGQSAQECLLDTGSSTLAFCDTSLEGSIQSLKTDYMSCNLYGSGNEGYWGFFYKGSIGVGSGLTIDSSYYSVMHQEVSMPCGSGLQGIFGVAFRVLDEAANHPSALNWPSGSVGFCPGPLSKDFVGPLMHYLKQDTPEGRLGIYWNGAVGSSTGELYIGAGAESNSHYTGANVQTATLGETGYYDISIEKFSFGGESYSVSCSEPGEIPCLVDTGTPIMFVPSSVYQSITNGQTGTLSLQLGAPSGSVTLEFDAETLANNQYIAPYQGGPYILGLPLWAFYYTVFNVDGRTISFVQHSSSDLVTLKHQKKAQNAVVV